MLDEIEEVHVPISNAVGKFFLAINIPAKLHKRISELSIDVYQRRTTMLLYSLILFYYARGLTELYQAAGKIEHRQRIQGLIDQLIGIVAIAFPGTSETRASETRGTSISFKNS